MVEHEHGAVESAEHQRDWPEDVGRVARLYDSEPAAPPRPGGEPCRRQERVDVLVDESELAAAWCVRLVLVQLHAIELGVCRVTLALRADDGDLVTGPRERLAFQPHPPIP